MEFVRSPSQRLGGYVMVDRIGQGAFGEVWLHHAWVERIVAVKIPSDPQYVRNLQKEGHAVHRLSHPNIVKAIAFDPLTDPPYFVMEFIPGTNIRTLIQRGPMEPKHAVAIMRQVLAALHHAHNHGMIHRDIKPENILIHPHTSAAIFGLKSNMQINNGVEYHIPTNPQRHFVRLS